MLEFNPNVTTKAVSPYGDGDEKTVNQKTANEPIPFGDGKNGKNELQNDGLNPYGNDIANFMNFGEDLSSKAMRETIMITDNVEKALINSKIFGGISFPAVPDPNKFGKGENAYYNYVDALHLWKENCLMIIKKVHNQSENSASVPIQNTVQESIENNSSEKVRDEKPVKPEPEPVRINVDYRAAQVIDASGGPYARVGWGTFEKQFIKAVTTGDDNETSYNKVLGRLPLNKTEVWALNDEILSQTNGEKSLLKLMEEEFNIEGSLFRSNRKITELYKLYKNYLEDTSMEKG